MNIQKLYIHFAIYTFHKLLYISNFSEYSFVKKLCTCEFCIYIDCINVDVTGFLNSYFVKYTFLIVKNVEEK